MFEAVIMLCLASPDGPCREVLLPGYEEHSQPACEARLAEKEPDLSGLEPFVTDGAPRCQRAGRTLDMDEIAPGIFVHVGRIEEPGRGNLGDVSNLGFVIGEASVAVIDTGSARWMGEALWRSIRARTDLPVNHVILTHMHPDHVLGATAFAGARFLGHKNLPRALADRQDNYLESFARMIGEGAFLGTTLPADIEIVADEKTVELGGRRLRLRAWPVAHTGTDLTVLDERTGTLFAGDLVFDRHTPALDGSLPGWQGALSALMQIEVEKLVPGHGGPSLPWPEGAKPLQRYLNTLARDTRAAIDAGERLGEAIPHIAASEAPHWQLFETHAPRNATVAFTELEWQ